MGDVALFDSMVQRMLELVDRALGQTWATEADWAALGAQMHSVKGSASTVGATRLAQIARELEELALQGRGAQADAVLDQPLAQLHGELARCRSAIEAELAARPPRPEEPVAAPASATLSDADRTALQDALRHNDLQALELYRRHKGTLKGQLPAARFSALDAHVRRLEFDQAADLLDELR
jgi:HPt (histidine-containing phosphotransfer) domain-containing protein